MMQPADLHWEPCGFMKSHTRLEGPVIHWWGQDWKHPDFYCINQFGPSNDSFVQWAALLVTCRDGRVGCGLHVHSDCSFQPDEVFDCAESMTWEGIVAVLAECEARSAQALQLAMAEDV